MLSRGSMRCAVLGDPIAHSLSPALHRAGYAAVGLDAGPDGWRYDAVRTSSADLAGFLAGLSPEWRGLSLTMPLKREVLALVDAVTERARRAGGANTVVVTAAGLHADNTDQPGAVAALRERWPGEVTAATVLGGGATAASVGLALCDLGARRVRLAVRSPHRATETAGLLRRHPSAPTVEVVDLAGAGSPQAGEVLASTVPVAAQTDDLVARAAGFDVVFEVVYDPWPTPVAAAATEAGAVLVSGLDLLVHQAALQFSAFTGVPAPLAAMRAAGEQALADRAARPVPGAAT